MRSGRASDTGIRFSDTSDRRSVAAPSISSGWTDRQLEPASVAAPSMSSGWTDRQLEPAIVAVLTNTYCSTATTPEQSSFADSPDRRFHARSGDHFAEVITPAHAHQYEIASAAGAWPGIQEGKRRLVRLLADTRAKRPDSLPITLWDLSSYSSVTTEALPAAGSTQEMRFYWDSSHFKVGVGDYVLTRIFGVPLPGGAVPAEFGRPLTPDTVERVLAAQTRAQAAYRARDTGNARHLRALVARRLGATGS